MLFRVEKNVAVYDGMLVTEKEHEKKSSEMSHE